MRDTYRKLNQRYESWDQFTSNPKSSQDSYKDVISLKMTSVDSKNAVKSYTGDIKHVIRGEMNFNTKASPRFISHVICRANNEDCCCEPNKHLKEVKPLSSARRYNNKLDSKLETPKSSELDNPLNKSLKNVNKALSFEKRCNDKINQLIETQQQLRQQIDFREMKDIEICNKLKEAQTMWHDMETNYKTKIQTALDKVDSTLQQKKQIEASVTKWRLNKKNLEFEIVSSKQLVNDLKDSIKAKTDQLNCMSNEIQEIVQNKQATTNQIELIKELINKRKIAFADRVKRLSAAIAEIKALVYEENKVKKEKQLEGNKYASETREDLHKIYRLMLHKKLKNEHFNTQKETIQNEIALLKRNIAQIKGKFFNINKNLSLEMAKIDSEITQLEGKCIASSKCIDTSDVRNFCTHCPKCVDDKLRHNCVSSIQDLSADCVCVSTKEKLMGNILKNINTVLESQIETPAGKDIANEVLSSLNKSRNGKLDGEMKRKLENFVLTSVKKNFNSTIISGAMKTRCEMNSDEYMRLMLCLDAIKVPRSPKDNQNVDSSKKPCCCQSRDCIKVSKPFLSACSKQQNTWDNKISTNTADEDKVCTHRRLKASFGTNCCTHTAVMSQCYPCPILEANTWKQSPCNSEICLNNTKNLRAAQYTLGEDFLSSFPTKVHKSKPQVPEVLTLYNQGLSKHGPTSKKSGGRRDGPKHQNDETSGRSAEKATNIDVRCTLVINESAGKRSKWSSRKCLGPKYEKAIDETMGWHAVKMRNMNVIRCAIDNDGSIQKRSAFAETTRCILSQA